MMGIACFSQKARAAVKGISAIRNDWQELDKMTESTSTLALAPLLFGHDFLGRPSLLLRSTLDIAEDFVQRGLPEQSVALCHVVAVPRSELVDETERIRGSEFTGQQF